MFNGFRVSQWRSFGDGYTAVRMYLLLTVLGKGYNGKFYGSGFYQSSKKKKKIREGLSPVSPKYMRFHSVSSSKLEW